MNLQTSLIRENPDNPRSSFTPDAIKDLAASMHSDGLLSPIIVRVFGHGYMVICGHRRLAAARMLEVL